MKTANLIGRILFSVIFIVAFTGHFSSDTIAFAASQGVPLANIAVPASGILSLIGGLSIAFGFKTRLGAAALIAFLAPVTVMLHNFWTVSDPMMHQMQFVNFLKNLGLMGGALMYVVHGAGALSLDAWLEKRTAIRGPVTAAA